MKAQISTLALCAMTLAACNHDKDDAPQPANSGEIVVDANVGQMSEKKAMKLGTTFDAGDEISVYAWTGTATEIPAELQVNNSINTLGTDGKWAAEPKMLWKDGQSKHYFLGVYPQKSITNFTSDEYVLNTADQEASDVLVATNLEGIQYRSTSIPLKFTHVMARLDVNIKVANFIETPTEARIKVTAKTNATINHRTKAVTATGEATEIILPLAANIADGYLFSYSSIMIPQTGLDRVMIAIGDQTFTYTRSKDITLKSGYYTTLNLNVRRNEITVGDVSIVDWNTGETIEGDAIDSSNSTEDSGTTTDPMSNSSKLTELGKTFEAVDLGLPSGLKWASFNIGATKPEEKGGYFAWGETETKSTYSLDDYKYYKTITTKDADGFDVITSGYTKYCCNADYGYDSFTDALTTLELSDDVANVKLGGNWRIPTDAEWQELYNNCEKEWCQLNGVKGYKLTSPNGKFIFLPAAGYHGGSRLYDAGDSGQYMSSILDEYNGAGYTIALIFNSSGIGLMGGRDIAHFPCQNGSTVRPVFIPTE